MRIWLQSWTTNYVANLPNAVKSGAKWGRTPRTNSTSSEFGPENSSPKASEATLKCPARDSLSDVRSRGTEGHDRRGLTPQRPYLTPKNMAGREGETRVTHNFYLLSILSVLLSLLAMETIRAMGMKKMEENSIFQITNLLNAKNWVMVYIQRLRKIIDLVRGNTVYPELPLQTFSRNRRWIMIRKNHSHRPALKWGRK